MTVRRCISSRGEPRYGSRGVATRESVALRRHLLSPPTASPGSAAQSVEIATDTSRPYTSAASRFSAGMR